MKLCVIGTGYVGLVAGACLADTGHQVTCVDIDEEKINGLLKGVLPIYEPGLGEVVQHNIKDGRLSFTTEGPAAVRASDAVFIAVGTPPDEDGSADLKHVLAVAAMVGDNLTDEHKLVIVKSTVPVGTCDKVSAIIKERSDKSFSIVSNPEFLKEGAAVGDFLRPDRIIVGIEDEKARDPMREIYEPFVRTGKPIIFMDLRSSEMTKYASNAMLATKISFINEVATLCEKIGADVNLVRKGMSSDPRIGPHFIFPGVGYGGSCFPKDVKALVRTGAAMGVTMRILESVEDVNQDQKHHCYKRALEHFGDDLKGKTIAVWGLAFKPKTDDMREAPSIVTIEGLIAAGATVRATDPVAAEEARHTFKGMQGVEIVDAEYDCLEGVDALIICTEWNDYRNPDFNRIKSLMKTPVIIDGRNLYNPEKMGRHGFIYYTVGRPSPKRD